MPATVSNPKKTIEELMVKPSVLSTGHANRIVQHYFKMAQERFDVDMSGVKIEYNLRGKTAGMACSNRNRVTGEVTKLKLRFNVQAIKLDWDEFVKNTIPHEVAHMVCMLKPSLGKNHDAGWVYVARELGCTGERCHTMKLKSTRREYEYITDKGHAVVITSIRHGKIQKKGQYYVFRSGKGRIDRMSSYKLVT